MEIKVKALGEGQEKSQSQQEQELLDKHEQKENAVQEQKTSEPVAETTQVEEKKSGTRSSCSRRKKIK